jgi:translation initiation factor IF-2
VAALLPRQRPVRVRPPSGDPGLRRAPVPHGRLRSGSRALVPPGREGGGHHHDGAQLGVGRRAPGVGPPPGRRGPVLAAVRRALGGAHRSDGRGRASGGDVAGPPPGRRGCGLRDGRGNPGSDGDQAGPAAPDRHCGPRQARGRPGGPGCRWPGEAGRLLRPAHARGGDPDPRRERAGAGATGGGGVRAGALTPQPICGRSSQPRGGRMASDRGPRICGRWGAVRDRAAQGRGDRPGTELRAGGLRMGGRPGPGGAPRPVRGLRPPGGAGGGGALRGAGPGSHPRPGRPGPPVRGRYDRAGARGGHGAPAGLDPQDHQWKLRRSALRDAYGRGNLAG